MNKLMIIGRLTADPEIKALQNDNSVIRINVAVTRDYVNKQTKERETDFISVVAWNNTAQLIAKNYTKGSMISLEGSLRQNNYEDKNGQKKTTFEMLAEHVHYIGGQSKVANPSNGGNPSTGKNQPPKQAQNKPFTTDYNSDYEEFDDEGGDLPY